MRGQVVHVATDESDGFIRGDDGNRYAYVVADWISPESAAVGVLVDFDLADDRATMVCALPAGTALPLSGLAATIQRNKRLLTALGAMALLLVAISSAYFGGVFSGLTGDPHGPIKTYQVTGLANVRNMPTATGSTVLRQLNPGDSFSGRIYMSPDGQKRWIKSEGSEEYVSIVNLSEVGTAQPSASNSPSNLPNRSLPSDAEIVDALMQSHARNCRTVKVYSRSDTPWMPHSAKLSQVTKERDAILAFLEKTSFVEFRNQAVQTTLSSTGEPMSFERHYLVGSAEHPMVRDLFTFGQFREVSQEGRLMSASYSISVCLYAPNSIAIIDHETSKESDKTVFVRYRESFGPSNSFLLINRLGSINPELSTVYLTGSPPPDRAGIATLHNNDATGWKIEKDVLQ